MKSNNETAGIACTLHIGLYYGDMQRIAPVQVNSLQGLCIIEDLCYFFPPVVSYPIVPFSSLPKHHFH